METAGKAVSFESRGNQPLIWRIFEIGFWLLVFYIPFGVALNLGPEFDVASLRVLIIGFFLAWIVMAAFSKKPFSVFSLQGVGLLAILAISGPSIFFAQEPGWSWRKLFVFLSIFPLCFLATGLLSDKRRTEKTIDVLLASAVLVSLIALVQFGAQFFVGTSFLAGIYSKIVGPIFWGQSFSGLVAETPSWFFDASGRTLMRAFGLFPDPHMLSFFLGLVLPFIFAKILFEKKSSFWTIFVCALLAGALFLTFSRGGYLGILASGLSVFFVAWPGLGIKKKWLVLTAILLCLMAIIIFAPPVLSRFASSFLLSEGSSLGRLEIWKSSWQVFLSHPILGVGIGNYPREVEPLVPYRNPITSHNLYLDVASETGFFGLFVWLILIFGTLWQLLKSIRRGLIGGQKKDLAIQAGAAGSLIYFSVHSFFETAIFNPAILAVLMIVLALSASARESPQKTAVGL